jgi:hypothetical protein
VENAGWHPNSATEGGREDNQEVGRSGLVPGQACLASAVAKVCGGLAQHGELGG